MVTMRIFSNGGISHLLLWSFVSIDFSIFMFFRLCEGGELLDRILARYFLCAFFGGS